MSEADFSEIAATKEGETGHSDAVTAGQMMRSAREAAGLHIAALAVTMKIPVKKLEALEADRLDLLNDAVFVRALAASVCRTLKIDPLPVLAQLPSSTTPRLNSIEGGINAPFNKPGRGFAVLFASLLSKPSAIVVLALLVAGIAVVYFPDIKVSDWFAEPLQQTLKSPGDALRPSESQPSEQGFNGVTASEPKAQQLPKEVANASPASGPATQPNTAGSAPKLAVARGAALDTPLTEASRGVPAQPAAMPSGLVVFKAKGSSWVKVVDAKGNVQVNRTLVGGEVIGASGEVPLNVVIGRVDAIDVEIRGKAFSLAGLSKDNVARFEVK